jgi:hypothetical protein
MQSSAQRTYFLATVIFTALATDAGETHSARPYVLATARAAPACHAPSGSTSFDDHARAVGPHPVCVLVWARTSTALPFTF